MEIISCYSTTLALFFLCMISVFFIPTFSSDLLLADDPSVCVLNFTTYPYQPTGECSGHQETVNYWSSITSTLCCRNILTTFSKALAIRARGITNPDNLVFLQKDQWNNCTGSFRRQQTVSAQSCGFDGFYNGTGKCSSLTISTIQGKKEFKDAVTNCSNFHNNSFSKACGDCSGAVVAAKYRLLKDLNVHDSDDNENAICGVAVVTLLAAAILDNPTSSIDDLYSCLHTLDEFDPGYIKLRNSAVKAILAILIAFMALMLILTLIKYVAKGKRKKKRRHHKQAPVSNITNKEITTAWSGLYRFSKDEIENAINYSSERKCLGRGSAGQVYKGVLPSGQVVAIKHINKSNTTDSFTREVEGLSRVRHPNLVCLFGCCVEGGEHYLVYEYCPAGNLAQHLLRKDSVLTWERRVKILRECALALRYLHHYIDGCIVHRDIKLTNILLTDKLEPKLSDFGLAKMLGMEESKVFTDVRGTIGYMDPEYMSNAKLTCASDIYSFGIVALQLLSGQKVIELDLDARDQLTRKAKDVSMGRRPVTDFEDPRLNGNINRMDFESLLQIAVLCVAKSSKGRPTIDVVFDEMEKAWKNTIAEMKANKERASSATPLSGSMSRSLEVIPV